jgi:hypothetical protein
MLGTPRAQKKVISKHNIAHKRHILLQKSSEPHLRHPHPRPHCQYSSRSSPEHLMSAHVVLCCVVCCVRTYKRDRDSLMRSGGLVKPRQRHHLLLLFRRVSSNLQCISALGINLIAALVVLLFLLLKNQLSARPQCVQGGLAFFFFFFAFSTAPPGGVHSLVTTTQ